MVRMASVIVRRAAQLTAAPPWRLWLRGWARMRDEMAAGFLDMTASFGRLDRKPDRLIDGLIRPDA
jgi:hypothetical protein